jgi:predicted nucleic acid-binding Zn finger protein
MSRQSRRNKRDFVQRSIYHDLPAHAKFVKTGHFGDWIMSKGGACIHTTNQYEVARWRSWCKHDVAVLYKKADGTLTWTLSAADDYRAFMAECYG